MESINVVIYDFNDFARTFEEDDSISSTEGIESQVQKESVTLDVATKIVLDNATKHVVTPNVGTTSESNVDNMIDPDIKEPSTRI